MRRRSIRGANVETEQPDDELLALRASSAAFDERWGATLQRDRGELTEVAEQLSLYGSATVTRPNGVVIATILRGRFRTPIVEVTTERRDGARNQRRHYLRKEGQQNDQSDLILDLAFAVAWLKEVPHP